MSLFRRRLGVAASLALTLALGPATLSAHAAQRVEVVDVPSLKGNIDLAVARVNRIERLQARVVLPDGYDAQPDRRWPVLYLLHGVGDSSATWLDPRYGDLERRAKDFPGIVVLPESGRGYNTDLWLGGTRKGGNWERYFLDEVLPLMESRYRIEPGREHHAIGGLSAGGYGAELLAAQLPSYFGTVLSFSGFLNIEDPWAQVLVPFFSQFSYTKQWGRYGGPYVRAHNPLRLLVTNLRSTRNYVSSGNGLTDPRTPFRLPSIILGGVTEWSSLGYAEAFARRARLNGIDITFRSHSAGVHYWFAWRRELEAAIRWGLFEPARGPVDDPARNFTYATMAPHGNAWGLGFRFAALPTDQMILTRDGQHLKATGRGTVTITPGASEGDASGDGTRTDCAFTAELPLGRELPAGC